MIGERGNQAVDIAFQHSSPESGSESVGRSIRSSVRLVLNQAAGMHGSSSCYAIPSDLWSCGTFVV